MSTTQYDRDLEAAIESKRRQLLAAATAEGKRDAWYAMKSLIEARSTVQVRRMELAKGLAQ